MSQCDNENFLESFIQECMLSAEFLSCDEKKFGKHCFRGRILIKVT